MSEGQMFRIEKMNKHQIPGSSKPGISRADPDIKSRLRIQLLRGACIIYPNRFVNPSTDINLISPHK